MPRRVRAGFEFTKSISAKLRLHRPIKSPPGILRSINPLPMMERTVLFYDFHRQYRMPRSQNVLRLGQNRSLGPTGPISSGGTSGYAMRGSAYRSEEHTSELQSLMRISYAVFCFKNKITLHHKHQNTHPINILISSSYLYSHS